MVSTRESRAPFLRILFATNLCAFQRRGGGERVLLDSRDELRRRGHQVDLFDSWAHQIQDYDVVHYFHCPGWETWERIRKLARCLVVTPTLWIDDRPRVRLVRELRHFGHRIMDRWWPAPIDERDARYYLLMPDLLLPASDLEAALLAGRLRIPRERLFVVRNGVSIGDEAAAPFVDVAKSLAGPDAVLCVGSFQPVKNQLSLIRALRGTRFRAVFIGEPYVDDSSGYLERCQREAGGRHAFFGAQPHGAVLAAMRRSRVYVQPSLRETCGLAALEAAALGCSIAITERGATREYFSTFVSYLNPEDEDSIQEAVENAAARPADPSLSVRVRTECAWKRVGDQLEAAYHLAAARRNSLLPSPRGADAHQ